MNGSSTGGGGEFRQQPYRERESCRQQPRGEGSSGYKVESEGAADSSSGGERNGGRGRENGYGERQERLGREKERCQRRESSQEWNEYTKGKPGMQH